MAICIGDQALLMRGRSNNRPIAARGTESTPAADEKVRLTSVGYCRGRRRSSGNKNVTTGLACSGAALEGFAGGGRERERERKRRTIKKSTSPRRSSRESGIEIKRYGETDGAQHRARRCGEIVAPSASQDS